MRKHQEEKGVWFAKPMMQGRWRQTVSVKRKYSVILTSP